jgi:hypothetical protein
LGNIRRQRPDSPVSEEKTAKTADSGPSRAKSTLASDWFYLDPTPIPLRARTAEFFRSNSGILRLIKGIAAEFLYPQNFHRNLRNEVVIRTT